MSMLGVVFEFERDLLIKRTKPVLYAHAPKRRLWARLSSADKSAGRRCSWTSRGRESIAKVA